MKKRYRKIALTLLGGLLFAAPNGLCGQVYAKLNGLYALGGVVNPAVEFPLSEHATFQTELVWSPWESVTVRGISGPMKFGIVMNEYRRYFDQRNDGWYLAANAGAMLFDMTKPVLNSGIGLSPKSSKGYGMMFGLAGGYEWRLNGRWLVDIYFGWSFMSSFYNGYALVDGLVESGVVYNRGEIILTPHREYEPAHPDPWNGSSEWLPNKIGVSIGYRIFDPQRRNNP
jgi:hypothetical protein